MYINGHIYKCCVMMTCLKLNYKNNKLHTNQTKHGNYTHTYTCYFDLNWTVVEQDAIVQDWTGLSWDKRKGSRIKQLLPICLLWAGTVQDFFLKRLTSRWDQSHGDKRGSAVICQETRGNGWVQPSDHCLTKEICPWEKVQQKGFKGHFDLLWIIGTSFFLC